MTDRFKSLTVVLATDMREDDAQCIIDAIGMIKGVLSVRGNVSDPTDYVAMTRVRSELSQKLIDVLREKI